MFIKLSNKVVNVLVVISLGLYCGCGHISDSEAERIRCYDNQYRDWHHKRYHDLRYKQYHDWYDDLFERDHSNSIPQGWLAPENYKKRCEKCGKRFNGCGKKCGQCCVRRNYGFPEGSLRYDNRCK